MGHQILILAITGTHNPALPAELTQQLAAKGLQIRHTCLSYQGHTTFAVGTPDELKRELAEAGHPPDIIGETAVDGPESITLETVLDEVKAHREEFRKFVAYEKKDDKADKESKPRGKKVVPAAPATTGTEGTGNPPLEPTETVTTHAAPDENSPPSTGDAPQPTGNEES